MDLITAIKKKDIDKVKNLLIQIVFEKFRVDKNPFQIFEEH